MVDTNIYLPDSAIKTIISENPGTQYNKTIKHISSDEDDSKEITNPLITPYAIDSSEAISTITKKIIKHISPKKDITDGLDVIPDSKVYKNIEVSSDEEFKTYLKKPITKKIIKHIEISSSDEDSPSISKRPTKLYDIDTDELIITKISKPIDKDISKYISDEEEEDEEDGDEEEDGDDDCIIREGDKLTIYAKDNAQVPRNHLREYIKQMNYRKFEWSSGYCEFDDHHITIREHYHNGTDSADYTEKRTLANDAGWERIIKKLSNKRLRAISFFRASEWDSDASGYNSDWENEVCYSMDSIYYITQSGYFIKREIYEWQEQRFEKAAKENDNAKIIEVLDYLAKIGFNKMPHPEIKQKGFPYKRDWIGRWFTESLFKQIKDKALRKRAFSTWFRGLEL